MIHGFFEQLGLSPGANEKSIRLAYARLLKIHRPDEDPAAFQRLHTAYQQALQWCRHQASIPAAGEVVPQPHDAPVAPAFSERLQQSRPMPLAPLATRAIPHDRSDSPRFVPEDFARELSLIAVQGDSEALQRWLENHPGLWSLQLKQALGATLLQKLAHHPMPMPANCFDTLLAYFELDQVSRGANALLLKSLRKACSQRHAPIGRYLDQQPAQQEVLLHFEPEHFLTRLCKLCSAGDSANLSAWLSLKAMAWMPLERQHASQAALDWLRIEPRPMPHTCYERLAEFFEWPDDALGDGAEGTRCAAAERHLTWLMEPAHTHLLFRAVQDPEKRYASNAKARRLRELLTRPFSWSSTLLLTLSPIRPRELADFITRLCAATGLSDQQVHLRGRYFDPRALSFWSKAGAPNRVTWPKLMVWGVRALAFEALVCLFIGWRIRSVATMSHDATTLFSVLLGLPLYAITFNLLLLWLTAPSPRSRIAALLQAGFIPLLCNLALGASLLPLPHYLAISAALSMLLLAKLCYVKRDRVKKIYATLVMVYAALSIAGSWLIAPELAARWAAGFAMLFWVMSRPFWSRRIATSGY